MNTRQLYHFWVHSTQYILKDTDLQRLAPLQLDEITLLFYYGNAEKFFNKLGDDKK